MAGKRIKPVVYTIGHSNRTAEEFIELLHIHGIEQVIDVRTVPKSRYNPQFEGVALARTLKKQGIAYQRFEELGGFRRAKKDSTKNSGWRNASFRGYADYMSTPEFSDGLAHLEAAAHEKVTAFMCAEAVPWRCHRSLIADALIVRSWDVFDITSKSAPKKHKRTPFLRVRKGVLTYPAAQASLFST